MVYGMVHGGPAPHTLISVYAGRNVVAAAVTIVGHIIPTTLTGVPSKNLVVENVTVVRPTKGAL